MIQIPLHQVGQKIGESGRIDWFKTGKFVEFVNSSWMPDKLHVRAKVEAELVGIRNWCQLDKTYRKIRISHAVMFVALLIYILYLIMLNPYDDRGNLDPDYSINIWSGYFAFFLVIMAVMVVQVVMFRRA